MSISYNNYLCIQIPIRGSRIYSDVAGKQMKPFLTREFSNLSQRVKDLDADNGFLEHATQKLEKQSEGARLLIEISRNMRKLRQLVTMNLEENDD